MHQVLIWGTNPIRQSERLTGQSEKALIRKTKCDTPDIQIPKAYTDAVNAPEGVLLKEVMDYELAKLEEMNMDRD